MANDNLGKAKSAKNDEFYTQYADIEKEINAYLEYNPKVFKNKVVLLPCDDPEWSNFTKYFAQSFDKLGLKKLISTSYAPDAKPKEMNLKISLFEQRSPKFDKKKARANGRIFILERDRNGDKKINFEDIEWDYLEGDGDFRSDEVKMLRDEADIVVTNPPFSLFREFVAWIVEAKKSFIIIGNKNAITYREIFPLIMRDEMWLGSTPMSLDMLFTVPEVVAAELVKTGKQGSKWRKVDGVVLARASSVWFTNLDHGRRHEPLQLMTLAENKKFSKHKEVKDVGYHKYDNYDAIEVSFTDAIPTDFDGLMGVPISFLNKYNPEQFEIMGSQRWSKSKELTAAYRGSKTAETDKATLIDGRETYDRIFIKHRKPTI